MQFFIFNNADNSLELDEYSVLLIKEFKDLWDTARNKCAEDKTGKKRLRAYKEFTYIYLALDFKSPYIQYTEGEKHKAALLDSGLSEEDLKDEKFLAAYHKYEEMQNADPILSLIKTAYKTLHKMQIHLDNIDFEEIDGDGRDLHKPKDVIADIASIATMRSKLQELEITHKKNLAAAETKVRGDAELGLFDR